VWVRSATSKLVLMGSPVTGGTLVGGLAGAVAVSIATSGNENPGPAELLPLDESTAKTTLAELQLAQ